MHKRNSSPPILATGATGSIGTFFPKNSVIPLKIRLESSLNELTSALKSYNSDSFTLIHLAALSSVPECESNPDDAYRVNCEYSIKLFEAAAKAGCKRFIFSSTCHVYKLENLNTPISIEAQKDPKSVYAKSKYKAEKELKKIQKEYPETQLSIARIFSVLSKKPDTHFLYSTLQRRVENKDYSPIPGLNNIRDFLWANEVCSQLLNLVNLTNMPSTTNICSGNGTKVLDIVEKVFTDNNIPLDNIKNDDKNKFTGYPYIVGIPNLNLIG